MTFKNFVRLVQEQGWTLAELRCDRPPTRKLVDAICEVGPDQWELHVLRLEHMQKSVSLVNSK